MRGKLFDWHLLPSRSYELPVICVGNLAVGGTGKTPHVEYILRLLHAEGYRVAMLSRGYGRRTKGFVLATPERTAADIGDEPYQMLRNCPFATIAVCERRTVGMERLLSLPVRPDVVVLDDAYQHRYVKAGLNILLSDSQRLYIHDHLLPWGRLREPASAARRADIVIATKCERGGRVSLPLEPEQLYFHSYIVYGKPYHFASDGQPNSQMNGDTGEDFPTGTPVLLLSGIANPASLMQHLEEMGAREIRTAVFPDHHAFTAGDVLYINKEWEKMGSGAVAITTQKDAARLVAVSHLLSASLRSHLLVQPISVEIKRARVEQESFNQTILNYVSQNSRNSRMD